jgi:hypothetical protein
VTGSVPHARRLAALLAAVAWFGILLQLWQTLRLIVTEGRSLAFVLIAYFGYFTILTNLLVCWSLTALAAAGTSRSSRFMAGPFGAGGVATSIIFVALSYHLLLRMIWNPEGADWVANVCLHYVTPILYFVYWFSYVRRRTLQWIDPLVWGAYPIAYFVYALVRGEMINSYPYGFIDVSAIGYAATVRNGIALLVGFILVGEILVGIDRMTSARQRVSVAGRWPTS